MAKLGGQFGQVGEDVAGAITRLRITSAEKVLARGARIDAMDVAQGEAPGTAAEERPH